MWNRDLSIIYVLYLFYCVCFFFQPIHHAVLMLKRGMMNRVVFFFFFFKLWQNKIQGGFKDGGLHLQYKNSHWWYCCASHFVDNIFPKATWFSWRMEVHCFFFFFFSNLCICNDRNCGPGVLRNIVSLVKVTLLQVLPRVRIMPIADETLTSRWLYGSQCSSPMQ